MRGYIELREKDKPIKHTRKIAKMSRAVKRIELGVAEPNDNPIERSARRGQYR